MSDREHCIHEKCIWYSEWQEIDHSHRHCVYPGNPEVDGNFCHLVTCREFKKEVSMKRIFCDACGEYVEYGYGKKNTAVGFGLKVRENNYRDTVSEVGDCCVPCYNQLVKIIRRVFEEWREHIE